jgi:hypothetical protein
VLFTAGEAAALADRIATLLGDTASLAVMRREATAHLASHTRQHVAGLYLAALQKTAGSN